MADSVVDDALAVDDAMLDKQIEQARKAADMANATEPRAIAAYYDATNDLVVIRLKSGAVFSFPPKIAQGLTEASPEALSAVEVTPFGDALHWESLDADLHVPALLAGIFGTRSWMAQMQRNLQQVS